MSGRYIGSFYRLQPCGGRIPVYGSSFIGIAEKGIGSIYTKMRVQGSCIGSSYNRFVDRLLLGSDTPGSVHAPLCHDWI